MTVKETSLIMEIIRVAYQKTAVMTQGDAEKMLSLWSALFEEVPYEEVRMAVKSFILTDTKGYPPTIGQINALIVKAKTQNLPTAEQAWALVRKAIGNGIYNSVNEFNALPEICKKLVGDPNQLYDWANLDYKGLQVAESIFLKRYAETLKDEEFILALPPSVADARAKIGQSKVKQLAERITRNE